VSQTLPHQATSETFLPIFEAVRIRNVEIGLVLHWWQTGMLTTHIRDGRHLVTLSALDAARQRDYERTQRQQTRNRDQASRKPTNHKQTRAARKLLTNKTPANDQIREKS
jgi:hypothetical protein